MTDADMQPSDDEIRAMLDAAIPGPWAYRPMKSDDWGAVRTALPYQDDFHLLICHARDSRYQSNVYLSACRADGRDPWEANARLIAAAPDLAALALSRGEALAKAEAENAQLKKALWLMAREYERWHRVGDDRIEKRPYEQQTRAVQAAWDALGGDDA